MSGGPGVRTAPDKETEYARFLAHGDQGMASFLTKRLEIGDGGAVRGQHAQAFARRHGAEGAIGAQHGQGAAHAFDVEQGFTHALIVGSGATTGKSGAGKSGLLSRDPRVRDTSVPEVPNHVPPPYRY